VHEQAVAQGHATEAQLVVGLAHPSSSFVTSR
jgi:hypothetical protein